MKRLKPFVTSFWGIVAGVVVLVLVTAILTSAVAASRTEERIDVLVTRLQGTADQLDRLRDDATERQAGTLRARRNLLHQNKVLQRQIRVLVRYLRANGIEVPVAPGVTVVESQPPGRPQRPREPRPRPTPRPTPTPATTPGEDVVCDLVPALCPLLPGR